MFKSIPYIGRTSLLSTAMMMALIGCQPTTTEDLNNQEESEAQHEAEHKNEHDEHSHDEHDEHMEHDEHDHDAHEHEEHAHDAHAHDHDHSDGHAGHDHDSNRIKFDCEPELELGAFYHADSTPKTAHLLIDGIEYDFTAIDNDAAQNTYVTNIGFDEAHGLVWQVNDDEGVLSEIPASKVNDNSNLEQSKVLHECHKAS